MAYVWDANKAARNVQKHGVSFDEAQTVFNDLLASLFAYPDHSDNEAREIIVGHSQAGRLLVVSFTERPPDVRIISARVATRYEKQDYENTPAF